MGAATAMILLLVTLPSEEPNPMAVALFEDAAEAYEEGRYQDALESFEQAYALEPMALLQLNIGQCHRQLGNHEEAIVALRAYLEKEPDAADRDEVEQLIAEERALAAAEPPEPAAQPQEAQPEAEPLEIAPELWIAIGVSAAVAAVAVLGAGVIGVAVASQPEPVEVGGSLGTVVVP